MMIHDITAAVGANKKRRRVGRGTGSGRGKTSERGHKGAGARTGFKAKLLNEGGGMPLYRRLPIRGFSNAPFTVRYQVVNVGQLVTLSPGIPALSAGVTLMPCMPQAFTSSIPT